jgi:predicted RNase H-like nuclease
MEYITTYTGEDFSPLTPNISQIKIEDIAHALSLICRANGHIRHFYSVAQHCINCANEAKARGLSARVQLACLLHDGSEAYICDITRPVKKHFNRYLDIEAHIQDMIYRKFLGSPLLEDEHALVSQIDDDMLVSEFDALMAKKVFDRLPHIRSKPSFESMDYAAVENMYMRLADNLINDKKPIVALGIDGCRAGWCVVTLDSIGNSSIRTIKSIDELLTWTADVAIIDIPLFSEPGKKRKFDEEARARLKNSKRINSVFSTPSREVVHEVMNAKIPDRKAWYIKACEISEKHDKKKISQQTFAIIPKIFEVDIFRHDNPKVQQILFENHPELCFLELIGHPCKHHKSDIQGEKERINALRKHVDINALLSNHSHTSDEVARDDIVDTAALALSGLLCLENGTSTWNIP